MNGCILITVKTTFVQVYRLRKLIHIRNLTALVLLMIFSLSITPKIVLHQAIATHKHTRAACEDHQSALHFHQRGIVCDFDNLVVEQPFIEVPQNQVKLIIDQPAEHYQLLRQHIIANDIVLLSLRGPPNS